MSEAEHCEKCGCELKGEAAYIEKYDMVWCHSCADNDAESAYNRQQERLMEDPGLSLIEQQRIAYKIKHGLR
jgi:ribosome-binding protein aMBF1 (putative translation factor)